MFGLMKPQGCGTSSDQHHLHRAHYCGTCKSMGVLYGQSSRTLLNYDTVFMAELLSVLSGEVASDWQPHLGTSDCLSMPKNKADIAPSLRYAATANIMLAALKVDDQIRDAKMKWLWKGVRSVFSRSFRRANTAMSEWNLDAQQLWLWVEEQQQREAMALQAKSNVDTTLTHCAEPTAKITAAVFAAGADAIQRAELKTLLADLGRSFGHFAYILDAYEDFDQDCKDKQFNPLSIHFSTREEAFDTVVAQLEMTKNAIHETLKALPLPLGMATMYTQRLQSVLSMRVYGNTAITCSTETWRQKITRRWEYGKAAAQSIATPVINLQQRVQLKVLAAAVFVAPKTTEYLSIPKAHHSLRNGAVIIAFLAGLGILRSVKKISPSIAEHLKSTSGGCGDACGNACSGCCKGCGDSCNSTNGDKGCGTCVGSCCAACCESGCWEHCCDSCWTPDADCLCMRRSAGGRLLRAFLVLCLIGIIILVAWLVSVVA